MKTCSAASAGQLAAALCEAIRQLGGTLTFRPERLENMAFRVDANQETGEVTISLLTVLEIPGLEQTPDGKVN